MEIKRMTGDRSFVVVEVTNEEIENHLMTLDPHDKVRLAEKLILSVPKSGLSDMEMAINKMVTDNPVLSTIKTIIDNKKK